jgi:ribosomal protein S18 acetylase RimI-like enzyme
MPEIAYLAGSVDLLDSVEPLWEQLREHHERRSTHFADDYAGRTFTQRKAGLLHKVAPPGLRIDLARDTTTDRFVGYCISTVTSGHVGEVESIFVEPGYQGLGIGDALVRRALAWMGQQGAESKQVLVAVGNEEVLPFYSHYGFLPRYILMKQK